LALRDKTNDELFQLYDSDLVLRLRNAKNLGDTRKLLTRFGVYLGNDPPSAERAKAFLAQYADKKPRTLYRYAQMIKAFMKWYGESLDDVKVKVPKTLPSYTEDSDIQRLLDGIGEKRSHKWCIVRDKLMVEVGLRTGMRRGELAELEARDIHGDFLIVRGGKGGKDRVIPLTPAITGQLHEFVKDKSPEGKVFGLKAPCISMKIKQFARKAGLEDFHAHSLRHKYATDLLEAGVNIKVVQRLLGHERIATTEGYLAITDESLHEAVKKLDEHKKPGVMKESAHVGGEATAKIFESVVELKMRPDEYFPETAIICRTYDFFTMALERHEVSIESLEVRTSDPSVPYRVMLFEGDLQGITGDYEQEDLLQMNSVRQRLYRYVPAVPLAYIDRDGENKLHGGIEIYSRDIPVALLGEDKKEERLVFCRHPVEFTIVLRYR